MKKTFFLLVALIMFVSVSFASTKREKGAENKKMKPISPLGKKSGIFDFKKVEIDQFIDPAVCSACHTDIYSQWSGSMHSKAFVDPLWRAATKLFYKDAKEEGELLEMKACIKCHTPLGFRSHSISSPEEDYDKLTPLPAQGIFCNWCHNIKEVKHIGDAAYEVAPGGGLANPSTMLGPFKDSETPFHPTEYSELHTKSEFCGLCHNVSHVANNLPLETTYDEWKESPYNSGNPETTVNCQDCHMRQRPGIPATGKTERPDNPGKAAFDGPDRKHIWTHYFVGANTIVAGDTNAKMAIERLKNAADLEIIREGDYLAGQPAQIKVKVINSGAGHYLPTGVTEIREMWLTLKVKDASGKILFSSGDLDKEGNLDKNTVLYNTQFGDKEGNHTENLALADRVLRDYRIPPKGHRIESFSFNIPPGAKSPLEIETTLKYRSISPALAKKLLGEKSPEIPIIDMVSATEKIIVKD